MTQLQGAASGQASATGQIRRHARTQIRRAAADLLKQEVGGAWSRVWQSRIDTRASSWPYLKVYTDREDAQRISATAPASRERTLSLIVVAMLKIATNTEDVEDRMDDLAALIEGLLTEQAFQDTWRFITRVDLQTSEMDVILNADEEIDHAELTLTFSIKYMTTDGAAETLI
jgi:hypothetical protein